MTTMPRAAKTDHAGATASSAQPQQVVGRARIATADGSTIDINLWPRANALLQQLDGLHAGRCAVACASAEAFVIAISALLASGRNAVLVNPQRAAIDAGDVDVIISDQPAAGTATWLAVPDATAGAEPTARPFDDMAEVWFRTSGSSGQPGMVRKRFGLLRAEANAITATFAERLQPAVVAPSVPLHHRFGFEVACLWPLLNDWPLNARQCSLASALDALLRRQRAIVVSSPAFLEGLRALDAALPVGRIEAILSAGAPVPPELAQWVHARCGRAPIEVYGSTEVGTVATRQWSPSSTQPAWHPLAQVQIAIRANDHGERLHVRAGFTDGWVMTDDYVRATPAGFQLLGRVDSVVKIADKRVSLSAMDADLRRHPWVADARVAKVGGAHGRLGAVVILTAAGRECLAGQGRSKVVSGLRAELAKTYERVLLPRRWRFIKRWPDNAMGKVTHRFLLQVLEQPA